MTHVEIILQEMFRRVGDEYSPEKTKKDDWYWDHEWTEEEEESFKIWLADYLYSSRAARMEVMNMSRRSKDHCYKSAYWFVWNYGWKTKRN